MTDFSIENFRARAARQDRDWHLSETGDFHFNPDLETLIRENAVREAAVLIGVFDAQGGPRLLLTERTTTLRSHSGQIALPGGRADEGDRSFEETAMRECEEETGIGVDNLEIVGRLPAYLSGSGYRIHPIMAVISGDYQLKPNPDEVAAIFHVPLSFLMDEQNHVKADRDWQGRRRYFYEMPYENRYIWGVTAGILRVMYERLYID
ncbi:CoA pyrophosphatase [Ahrensia marina]|uniref:DNA mismatch repair protein MutT n=1 Tax=Ahrensia marina TaxID=1514904 RepID=A0A0N0VL39_9HYPH|nr:CoA pyrophosphatase [Ahrensia marina]KPB00461.1 DNA mismatch repair protein MutT [Ahrensia marina]